MKRIDRITLALTPLLLLAAGCSGTEQDTIACNGTSCFSIDKFGQNIRAVVNGRAMGWAYVIYYEGQAEKWDSAGLRRASPDSPQLNMSVFEPFNMGSVGKTLTTLGTLLALEHADVSVDSPIEPWLPPDWIVGPNVNLITFRDLLTHKSGLRTDVCHYNDMKPAIEAGINVADHGVPAYRNFNFCLLRVLIPYLTGHTPGFGNESVATAQAYRTWMQNHVFTTAGFASVEPFAPATNPTLYYSFPHLGVNGLNTATWGPYTEIEISGAGTWHPSPLQLASLMWMVKHTNDIISASQRSQMLSGKLGIYTSNLTGGTAYHHNGGFESWSFPYSEATPAGARAVFYMMPNDVVVTLVYNSLDFPNKMLDSPNAIVEQAYEDAWVPDPSP
jgi:CubicO group peptidase (beta-lactamase class C family)